MTKRFSLLITLLLVSCVLPCADAATFPRRLPYPEAYFHDITRPRTPREILSVYRWYIKRANGIDKREALIIAQREAVVHHQEDDYDVAKPKVIAEDAAQWTVRIPGKFSISQGKVPPDLVFSIDKKDGRVR